MGKTWKLSGEDRPLRVPEGRKGRRAVSWLLNRFASSDEVGQRDIVNLFNDDEFETQILPVLLDVTDEELEEKGTYDELFTAIMLMVQEVTEGMTSLEVEAAQKK